MWVCCSVSQCVAVCLNVLQCVALRCNVLHYVKVPMRIVWVSGGRIVLKASECYICSMIHCVAECCSVLQSIAVYHTLLTARFPSCWFRASLLDMCAIIILVGPHLHIYTHTCIGSSEWSYTNSGPEKFATTIHRDDYLCMYTCYIYTYI